MRTAIVFILFLLSSCAQLPPRPEPLINSNTGDLSVKKVEEFTLANGLRVLYLLDRDLPLVHGQLFLRGGSLYETKTQTGLASAVGDQLRDGGITTLSPEALDTLLDSRGASVESSFGSEFGTVSFSALSEDFEEIFQIFSNIVFQPRFDRGRLTLWKAQTLESIRRRKESPEFIASAVFNRVLYGANSPFSTLLTSKDLARITPERMRSFYRKFLRPNGSVLVLSGKLEPAQLRIAVESRFGSWKRESGELDALPSSTAKADGGVYLVPGRFEQASIIIGHEGPRRLTSDTSSIAVFNRYFGYDAFGSRLFSEVRSRLGLAYSVTGAVVSGPTTGQFVVMMGTRITEAARAIAAANQVIHEVQSGAPEEGEIERVKSSLRRAFPFNYATHEGTLSRAAQIDLMGYPKDWDYKFAERLSQVTSATVHQVAQERIFPERAITVVVGDLKKSDLEKALGAKVRVVRFSEVPEL